LKKGYEKERAIPAGVSVLVTKKTNRLCIHQVLKKKLAATDPLMFLPTANIILVLLAVKEQSHSSGCLRKGIPK
jgi:hypothetical protein